MGACSLCLLAKIGRRSNLGRARAREEPNVSTEKLQKRANNKPAHALARVRRRVNPAEITERAGRERDAEHLSGDQGRDVAAGCDAKIHPDHRRTT